MEPNDLYRGIGEAIKRILWHIVTYIPYADVLT